jgi:hypothetical protein
MKLFHFTKFLNEIKALLFVLLFSEGTEQEIGGGGGNFQGRVANR